MESLRSSVGAGAVELPLRPLLFTASAAATTAGIYWWIKRRDGEKTSAPLVCERAMKRTLVQPSEVPEDQVTDAVTKVGEKTEKLVESNTQLEDRVRELEKQLCETRRDYEMKSEECERGEKRYQKAMETVDLLESEKCDLNDHVKTLRETVQDMGHQLAETHRECYELMEECEQEREAQRNLKHECDELKATLIHKEEALKTSLAEAEEKHGKAEETINHLESEKCDQNDHVKTLRETVQDMGLQLAETHRECYGLMEECEREREAQRNLKHECDGLKATLIHKEGALKELQEFLD